MPPSALAGGWSPHTASTSSPRDTTRFARVASTPSTARCRGCPAWTSRSSRQAVTGPRTPTRSGTTAPPPPSCCARPAWSGLVNPRCLLHGAIRRYCYADYPTPRRASRKYLDHVEIVWLSLDVRSSAGLVARRSGPVAAVRPSLTRLNWRRSRTGAGRPPPRRPAPSAGPHGTPLTPAVRAGVHNRRLRATTHRAGPPFYAQRRSLAGAQVPFGLLRDF